MNKILLQSDLSNSETKAIRHLAALRDDIEIYQAKLSDISSLNISKDYIPVGGVEFTKEYLII